MPKKYKIIEDAMKATSSVAPAPPKPPKELTANKSIKQKMNVDRLANKRANSETPKNNGAVFSPKPEPNRGTGSERRPSVPRNHNTRPTMEGKESEYGANKELTGTFKLATIKSAMQKKSGLSDYHSHNDKLTQKKPVVKESTDRLAKTARHIERVFDKHKIDDDPIEKIKKHVVKSGIPKHRAMDHIDSAVRKHLAHSSYEHYLDHTNNIAKWDKDMNSAFGESTNVSEDAGAVSVGSGAVAGITDPTTNYAFQVLKKKQNKLARRKKPVGEEVVNELSDKKLEKYHSKVAGMSGKHSIFSDDRHTSKKRLKGYIGASARLDGVKVSKHMRDKYITGKYTTKEEFSAGIGNTQAPADSKKTSDKKSLSSFRKKKGDKVASPPSSPSDVDTSPAIGGQ
jgi:hypothetical protein